jgi:hypothetical protein
VRVRRITIGCFVLLISNALAQSPPTITSESTEMRVRLLAPLTTKLNRKGDMVSASVLEPAKYQGAILEGEILDVHPGSSPANNRSYIQLQFHTLHSSGAALPVVVNLVDVFNSKKQPDIDEENTMVELAGGTALGGVRTAIAGRIHRETSDSGPISGAPFRLAAKAPNLSLAPGGELVLRFKLKPR